jgi:hypothetical protein
MRFHMWPVVVLVGFCVLTPGAAAGAAPLDAVPAIEAGEGNPATVTDTQRGQLAAPEFVTVRVYSPREVTADAIRAALDVAGRAFVRASVGITWKICGPAECETAPSPAELVVRFVSSQGRRGDFRCLGEALIDTEKRAGVLATVYLDRVLQLARSLRIDDRILLGWTIGHEIGHLLLATSTHGGSGLMREVWSRKELRLGREDDWVLHPFEVAAIRQRLTLARSS